MPEETPPAAPAEPWNREPDGSYLNTSGWRVKMIAQRCWQITRPNGFRADNLVYRTAAEAQGRVDAVYARQNVA